MLHDFFLDLFSRNWEEGSFLSINAFLPDLESEKPLDLAGGHLDGDRRGEGGDDGRGDVVDQEACKL